MTKRLSIVERRQHLKNLNGWEEVGEGDALTKSYVFSTFEEAFSFMTRVALHAEKINHHPEWRNIYNKVHVILTTHESKGISAKDIALALYMDEAAFAFLNPCMTNQTDLVF